MTRTSWRIAADVVSVCNCAWGCPCQFNALPTRGRCEATVAIRIREGHYGSTDLGGVSFATGYWWPGPIHHGNGIAQLVIDEHATPEQRRSVLNITSGKEGGTLFEIYDVVVSKRLVPIYARIAFQADRVTRVAHLSIPGFGEFRTEPIRNPVTGEEHHARIELPNGFEFKVAELANCLEQHATIADKRISNRNTHAHFAAVEWTNA